ncbi:MAG TPA: hypothetical protein DCF33_20700 [Saprospirales bacterium]|nr:hypothetical protein [Saprospirales bacterium]
MKESIIRANEAYSKEVADLLKELSGCSDLHLNRKPSDQGWSAIQTIHHLILVEENAMAYLRKKLSFDPELKPPGWLAGLKMLLLKTTLALPIKFKAPKSAGSDKIPETDTLESVKSRWMKTRSDWTFFFESMPENLLNKAVYRHPIIGLISWLQTISFLSTHFNRHKRQIKRAIS